MRKFTLLVMACLSASMTFASGNFSVSANRQVVFAPGNLQWHPKDSLWRIAPSQLDWCGNANIEIGNPDYDGWVDLLSWSLGEANNFGATSNYDTLTYCNKSFVDWGNLFPGEHWFTLSSAEWRYLLNQRPGWNDKWGMAIIGDTLGMILLPDEWTAPEGVDFVPGTLPTSELWDDADMIDPSYDHYRVKKANMPANKFTVAEWQKLEDAGALFIPYTGRRSGGYGNYLNAKCLTVTEMYRYSYYENYVGTYWTRTLHNAAKGQADYVYTFYYHKSGDDEFYDWGIKFAIWSENGRYGQSVRLAKAVPAVGDTIRYEYKGNTLYYKILSKNATNKAVGLVNDGTSEIAWTEANKPTGALVIPDSVEDWQGTKYAVTDMYARAFQGCTNITSIDFSENTHIQTVGFCGFLGCTKVASITLSDYIKTIDGYAFQGLVNVYSIDLKKVERINQNAFNGCKISTVNLPQTLAILEPNTYLFYNANTITIDAENPNFVVIDNVLYNKDVTKLFAFPGNFQDDDEIHIPATVTAALTGSLRNCYATVYIQSEITFDEHNWSNSPMKDVVVACGLYDYYTTGYYEGVGSGSTGDFQNVDNLSEHLFWTVEATADANGSVSIPDTTSCDSVHIIAEPAAGYVFDRWSNGLTDADIRLEVLSDTAVTAYFKPLISTVELTISKFPQLNETVATNSFDASVDAAANYEISGHEFIDNEGHNLLDEFTFVAGSYKVRVGLRPKDGYTFPSAIGDITATINDAAPADLYLEATTPPIVVLVANFTVSTPSAIDSVTDTPSSVTQKLLKDGQLYILRNGKLFNAQGARVE